MSTLPELKELHKNKKSGTFERVVIKNNENYVFTDEWVYIKPTSVTNPVLWKTGITKGKNKQHTKIMRKIHNQLF